MNGIPICLCIHRLKLQAQFLNEQHRLLAGVSGGEEMPVLLEIQETWRENSRKFDSKDPRKSSFELLKSVNRYHP